MIFADIVCYKKVAFSSFVVIANISLTKINSLSQWSDCSIIHLYISKTYSNMIIYISPILFINYFLNGINQIFNATFIMKAFIISDSTLIIGFCYRLLFYCMCCIYNCRLRNMNCIIKDVCLPDIDLNL